mmetsp:Transcript_62297/g.178756  ORF Transcript_62297/g.178756 Transcript_62297/m.178756 type:complete len:519 (+) Transcript_62297:85-1641(+)
MARPSPLSDDDDDDDRFETGRPAPLSAPYALGPKTLLGRTSLMPMGAGAIKKPVITTAVVGSTPTKPQRFATLDFATPGSGTPSRMQHLITPMSQANVGRSPLATSCTSGQPQQWAFTPIATPSPSYCFSLFESQRWGPALVDTTPGAKAAAALAKPAPAPNALSTALGTSAAMAAVPSPQLVAPESPQTTRVFQLAPQQTIRERWSSPADDEEDQSDDDSDDGCLQQVQAMRSVEDVPEPPPGALHPSLGSEGHVAGTCKRCCFFPRGRCSNGYECEFCHYEHDKRKRKNKKKGKRMVTMVGPKHLPSYQTGASVAMGLGVQVAMGGAVLTSAQGIAAAPSMMLHGIHQQQHCLLNVAYHGQMAPAYQAPQIVQGSYVYGTSQMSGYGMQQDAQYAYYSNAMPSAPVEMQQFYQMADGSTCILQQPLTMMTAPPCVAATFGMPQQANSQVVMLEPAMMSQLVAPEIRAPGVAELCAPPPPPPQSPKVVRSFAISSSSLSPPLAPPTGSPKVVAGALG